MRKCPDIKWSGYPNTVMIRKLDVSGFQMVDLCPVVEFARFLNGKNKMAEKLVC
jgi:hypothetical protein